MGRFWNHRLRDDAVQLVSSGKLLGIGKVRIGAIAQTKGDVLEIGIADVGDTGVIIPYENTVSPNCYAEMVQFVGATG